MFTLHHIIMGIKVFYKNIFVCAATEGLVVLVLRFTIAEIKKKNIILSFLTLYVSNCKKLIILIFYMYSNDSKCK